MKFGFSTLGCPTWDFKEIFSSAKDLGYNGVEIRGLNEEIYAPSIKQFSEDRYLDTMKYLCNMDIEIAILSSAAEIAVHGKEEAALKEAKDYIELASRLKVPFIRVLCTNSAMKSGGDINLAKKQYKEIAKFAEDKNVIPLVETNGLFVDSALLKEFIESIDSANKGILWDIHHPYRFNSEDIDTTLGNIGKHVKYVHIKDSIIENGQVAYKMTGYGNIPIKDAVVRLRNSGYDGYLTLEWLKRWDKTLEEPGVALCQYISYIKSL